MPKTLKELEESLPGNLSAEEKKQLQARLRAITPADQTTRDVNVWNAFLTNPKSGDEENAAIMKRVFTLMQQGLQYRPEGSTDFQSAANAEIKDNQSSITNEPTPIPLASWLSHGGMINVKIPRLTQSGENPDKLFNWIRTGNSTARPSKAVAKTLPLHSRTSATHSFSISKNGEIKERTLQPWNPFHWPAFISDRLNGRHYGMNLGLGSPTTAAAANGENGHLYVHYIPPTTKKPGVLAFVSVQVLCYAGTANLGSMR